MLKKDAMVFTSGVFFPHSNDATDCNLQRHEDVFACPRKGKNNRNWVETHICEDGRIDRDINYQIQCKNLKL